MRSFKQLGPLAGMELPASHRTFGCRRRHMCVGDFSAQYLNGRRQAMIFRLRGVALFGRHSCEIRPINPMRASPPETGRTARPSGCRWRLSAGLALVFSRSTQAAPIAAPGADVHIANSLWSPCRVFSKFQSQNWTSNQSNSPALKAAQSFSNPACTLD